MALNYIGARARGEKDSGRRKRRRRAPAFTSGMPRPVTRDRDRASISLSRAAGVSAGKVRGGLGGPAVDTRGAPALFSGAGKAAVFGLDGQRAIEIEDVEVDDDFKAKTVRALGRGAATFGVIVH